MSTGNEALWVESRRATFRVGAAPFPTPRAGEIVVGARALALNPVDAVPGLARRFVYPWLRYPTVLGTDVAGEVLAVGDGVQRFGVGDRVVGLATGQERFSNDPAQGAFQRCVVLAEGLCTPVPDDVALTAAAVLPLALTTAAAGLFEPDQLRLVLPGGSADDQQATVLVWGAATSVGLNAVQLAANAGYRVVATASPRNFALVRSLGAAEVLDYHERSTVADLVASLRGHTLAGTVAIGRGSLAPTVRIARRSDGTRRVASAYPSPVTAVRKQLARPYGVRVSAIWGGTPAGPRSGRPSTATSCRPRSRTAATDRRRPRSWSGTTSPASPPVWRACVRASPRRSSSSAWRTTRSEPGQSMAERRRPTVR